MNKWIRHLVMALVSAAALASCGGGGDGPGQQACVYESRHTGCGNSTYTAWTAGCFAFNPDAYTISAQQVCSNVTAGGSACAAGCCVTSQYRNGSLREGGC